MIPFQPVVIGVGGGSGAGKSVVVRRLYERLPTITVVDLDSYYRDRQHLPLHERMTLNYDEPDAFDLELIREHVDLLRRGTAVDKPVYSFQRHARVGSCLLRPSSVLVVEGLLALWWTDLLGVVDRRVFLHAPADVRLARRIQRDTCERGRSAEAIVSQYLSTVREMHERYVEPTRGSADVVIDTGHDLEAAVEELMATLQRSVAR